MSIQEVKEKIMDVIVESTETEIKITEETTLYDEMGLASIEVVVLLNDLEETFGIKIPVSELRKVHTVGDLCGLVVSILKES